MDGLIGIFHEIFHQGKFDRRQLDLLTVFEQLALILQDGEYPRMDGIVLFLHLLIRQTDAAQERIDARQKFLGAEGLDHIIICTQFQALDLVLLLPFSSQHDDAHRRISLTDPAADFKTIDPWQHDVQQSDIHRSIGLFQSLLSAGRFNDLKIMALEIHANKAADSIFIFDDQNFGSQIISLLLCADTRSIDFL